MKKRRKLYHFADMIRDGIEFYDYHTVTDGHGNKGTSYLLADPLTDEQVDKLKKYDNTVLTMCECHIAGYYASTYTALILMK